jgi:hypothetical protein
MGSRFLDCDNWIFDRKIFEIRQQFTGITRGAKCSSIESYADVRMGRAYNHTPASIAEYSLAPME